MSAPLSKVLLVDDEPKLLSALRRRLSNWFEIETAEHGEAALAALAADPAIGVIVADMQMPGMNGVELLKRVRVAHPAVRRMMLTGNADQETAIAAVNEGQVMRFLRKPCEAETLKEAIDRAFEDIRFEQDEASPAAGMTPALNEARDSFLSMMSHELRTPLNHIIGLANLLDIERPIGADPVSHDYLRQISESGESLLQIVNRVLEYSRLRSEIHDAHEVGPVDLVALVHQEVERQRPAAAKRLITFSVDSLRKRIEMPAHEGELRLALRELLANAVKFNRPEGHVSIVIKCDAEWAAIRIADTGCGMPREFCSLAGAPFVQAEQGLARRHEGVGLGLALVDTIARANDGVFRIESEEGKGATAILALRRRPLDSRDGTRVEAA
ncbi:MAG: hybrid sensor histidine kinase/response regulator [Parvularculaceae bacterium]|nr:hybrid sensor histidine kinase/response regulator [Parvularculaceae bacterium]